jgi:hypothetical protein
MQEEVQKEVIKVEPVKEEPLFYENGDLALHCPEILGV